jgi:hypothetical protein
MAMYEHHARGIDRLVTTYRDDPRFEALLIGGSIAKGRAREDSDIDVLFLATEEEFQRRLATHDIAFYDADIADHPGCYVEGRILSRQFLLDAIARGSEPTRAAFQGAIIAYSRIDDLDALLIQVVQYPEHERREKLGAFYSQVVVLNWFMQEADKRGDLFLASWSASEMVLYGARLVLAHNRILYPYTKWLMYDVDHAPERPASFRELADQLIRNPTGAVAQAFLGMMREFQDWGVSDENVVGRFALTNEWQWREHRPALQDW